MDGFKSHSIPFQSPVFTLAAHPSEPLLTAGLLSGHVYTYTWPKEVPSDDEDEAEDGLPGGYKVAWKTRRHKGSCRSAAYSNDGQGMSEYANFVFVFFQLQFLTCFVNAARNLTVESIAVLTSCLN